MEAVWRCAVECQFTAVKDSYCHLPSLSFHPQRGPLYDCDYGYQTESLTLLIVTLLAPDVVTWFQPVCVEHQILNTVTGHSLSLNTWFHPGVGVIPSPFLRLFVVCS